MARPATRSALERLKARRSADNDSIFLDWVATTNERSHQRVAMQLAVAGLGGAKATLYHESRGTSIWQVRQLLIGDVKTTPTSEGGFQTESGTAVFLTGADLQKEIVMWVEAKQSDAADWKASTKVTLAAVSSGSG